jgi:hypothetical protein
VKRDPNDGFMPLWIDARCPKDITDAMDRLATACGKKHFITATIELAHLQVLVVLHLRAAINREPEPDTSSRWHYGPIAEGSAK